MKRVVLIVISMLAVRLVFGQQTTDHDAKRMPPEIKSYLQRLLDRADAKRVEGVELRRRKAYASAEADFEMAIDILKSVPAIFQYEPKNELAQTYLAEGQYDHAIETWEPLYHPDSEASVACGLAIAYVHTHHIDEAVKCVTNVSKQYHEEFLQYDDLPLARVVNASNVEASAILLWTMLQPDFERSKEMIESLEAANKISPHNGSINYFVGYIRNSFLNAPWKVVEPNYLEAYRYGNAMMRSVAKGQLLLWGTKLPDPVRQ